MAEPDLGPPWIIFADKGKSVAILPAGRPGTVADVSGIPDKLVAQIVNAANQPVRSATVELLRATEAIQRIHAAIESRGAKRRPARTKRKGET